MKNLLLLVGILFLAFSCEKFSLGDEVRFKDKSNIEWVWAIAEYDSGVIHIMDRSSYKSKWGEPLYKTTNLITIELTNDTLSLRHSEFVSAGDTIIFDGVKFYVNR